MIRIDNVSMYYPVPRKLKELLVQPFKRNPKYKALFEISLDIKTGERLAFLGPNGAGKTTLLKLVGGLLYPTEGNIYVNGFNTITDNARSRRSVGFVLNEERSFYWRLTGVQNLQFFGALDNLEGKELKQAIELLISLVGLEEFAHKLVATYSSGMKQRLAIARGLLANPDILILDEPTKALDPEAVDDIKDIIVNRIHKSKERTMLIATHNFGEAEALCDKICILKKGVLLSQQKLSVLKTSNPSLIDYYRQTVA